MRSVRSVRSVRRGEPSTSSTFFSIAPCRAGTVNLPVQVPSPLSPRLNQVSPRAVASARDDGFPRAHRRAGRRVGSRTAAPLAGAPAPSAPPSRPLLLTPAQSPAESAPRGRGRAPPERLDDHRGIVLTDPARRQRRPRRRIQLLHAAASHAVPRPRPVRPASPPTPGVRHHDACTPGHLGRRHALQPQPRARPSSAAPNRTPSASSSGDNSVRGAGPPPPRRPVQHRDLVQRLMRRRKRHQQRHRGGVCYGAAVGVAARRGASRPWQKSTGRHRHRRPPHPTN